MDVSKNYMIDVLMRTSKNPKLFINYELQIAQSGFLYQSQALILELIEVPGYYFDIA
jgi:hypothetical protein